MKKSAIVVVLALLLLAVGLAQRANRPLPYTTTSRDACDLFLKGDEEIHALRWEKAQKYLEQALQIDPDFAMAQAALATVVLDRQKDLAMKMAARADSLAAGLSDENERMLIQMRLAFSGLIKTCNGDSILDLLSERLPRHEMVLSTLASRARNHREYAKAAEYWNDLLRLNPNYASAHNDLGYNAAYQGHYEEAEAHLRKYVYLAPNLANPHDSLGEILMWQGRYKEAEVEFLEALRIQPNFIFSLYNLARVYIEQGRVHKGLDIIRQTMAEVKGTLLESRFRNYNIRLFWANDLHDELMACMREYFTSEPDEFWGGYRRSLYMLCQDHYTESRAVLDSLLASAKTDSSIMAEKSAESTLERIEDIYEAMLAERTEQPEMAVAAWERIVATIAQYPPHERLHYIMHYGRALVRVKRYEDALAQAQEILSVNPNHIPGLILLTETSVELGQWDQAHRALANLQVIMANADGDLPARAKVDSLQSILDRQRES